MTKKQERIRFKVLPWMCCWLSMSTRSCVLFVNPVLPVLLLGWKYLQESPNGQKFEVMNRLQRPFVAKLETCGLTRSEEEELYQRALARR
jgi:hypothetical protein